MEYQLKIFFIYFTEEVKRRSKVSKLLCSPMALHEGKSVHGKICDKQMRKCLCVDCERFLSSQ